jgi:hypothetical protein
MTKFKNILWAVMTQLSHIRLAVLLFIILPLGVSAQTFTGATLNNVKITGANSALLGDLNAVNALIFEGTYNLPTLESPIIPGSLSWGTGTVIASSSAVCQSSGINCPLLPFQNVTVSMSASQGSCATETFSYTGLTTGMVVVITTITPPGGWIFTPSLVSINGDFNIDGCNISGAATVSTQVHVVAISGS